MLGIYCTIGVGILAACFLFFGFFTWQNGIAILIGVVFTLVFASGLYSDVLGHSWSLEIQGDRLRWHSPRLPRSSGELSLTAVRKINIECSSSKLVLESYDGSKHRVKIPFDGARLAEFLSEQHPGIDVEHIPDTG
ncbi:MAG: hypothetical protein AAGI68_09865 [Planctomycetota bacterium]